MEVKGTYRDAGHYATIPRRERRDVGYYAIPGREHRDAGHYATIPGS